jgi:hypothetical protein
MGLDLLNTLSNFGLDLFIFFLEILYDS